MYKILFTRHYTLYIKVINLLRYCNLIFLFDISPESTKTKIFLLIAKAAIDTTLKIIFSIGKEFFEPNLLRLQPKFFILIIKMVFLLVYMRLVFRNDSATYHLILISSLLSLNIALEIFYENIYNFFNITV